MRASNDFNAQNVIRTSATNKYYNFILRFTSLEYTYHYLARDSSAEEKIAKDDQTDTRGTKEQRDQLSGNECKTSSGQIPTQNNSSPAKKVVGLTKIRLEDCLRCDACSCIYIDENDYNKHMKNFHRQDSPKKHKQKKGCRSCCKHCNCRGNHQQPSVQKERGNNNLFHYNIKDRWTKMVSRRLNPKEIKREIKPDPDGYPNNPFTVSGVIDYSHLLSQVEVKIKTEPSDLEY
ncbi:unnamed protein product [Timema podura]|uniref:C2H2-type domain-containing protein n=1 Tax=Timema podura TaxID=61482 RepID=A0ABN7P086_TIMPD|nr:unnamed protein product [Timema podura]